LASQLPAKVDPATTRQAFRAGGLSRALRTRPGPVDYDRFDERSLVESARHDANAFAALYRRYVDRIYAYAFRRSQSRAVAEDVTAATFEKALRGLDRYRWREPGIGPWLFRIASNQLVDHYRSSERQRRIVDRLADATVVHGDVGDGAELDAELLEALQALSPRYQRAIGLRFLADLTNEEAALAMGVSRSTMAVILHRARAALRKQLEQKGRMRP